MPEIPISQEQMAELMKLAGTPSGKKLLFMLQKEKGPALKRALNAGDFDQAKEIVKNFMKNPEVQRILQELGR